MQEHRFSSALGGPHTGVSALQGSRAVSPRGSSPRGYTMTRAQFGFTQPSLKQSGKSTTNMSSRQPSMVGNGDTSSTGLPRDKPSRRPKSTQTPVPPKYFGMQNNPFLPELGKVDKEPLGFATGYETQNRVPLRGLSVSPTCNRVQPTGGSFNAKRNRASISQGCHNTNHPATTRARLHLNCFLSPKEGWRSQTSYKPACPESLHLQSTLQDGRCASTEGLNPIRRLGNAGEPQGCVTHPSNSPKVPEVHMEATNLSIHMPPIQPQFSPTSIHQTHETGEWLSSEQRSKECGVYRRPTADSTISRTPQTTHTRNLEFVRGTRVPSKLPKVPVDPYPEHNIPGVCSGLPNGRTQPPKFQGQKYSEGSTASHTTSDYSMSTGTINWKAVSSDPGSLPSPTSLLKHTAAQTQGNCIGRLRPALSQKAKEDITWGIQRMPDWNGRKMLDSPPQLVIETDPSLRGWGAYSCVTFTGGCWSPEEALLHINVLEMLAVLYGIKSFVKGEAKVKTILIKSENFNSGVLSESHGGYKVSNTDRDGSPGVGMVPSKEQNPLSPVSTGVGECQSRLFLPIPNQQNRLAPQPKNIPGNQPAVGTPGSRPFRHKTDSTVTLVLQLETRSRGRSGGRICTGVDQNQGFCSSAMVPHSQTPTMCTAPESNLGPHCSSVANTAMVPYSTVPVDRLTGPSSHSLDMILPSPNCDNPLQQSPPQLAAWRVSGNNLLHREFRETLSSLPCHPGGRKQTATLVLQPWSSNLGPHCSSVAITAVVPYSTVPVDRLTSPSSPLSGHDPAIPQLRQPPAAVTTATGRMEGLRQQFTAQGIPPDTIKLILSSWRQKTNSNYNSAWRKWEQWCQERDVNPFLASLPDILSFLIKQFQDGKQYRSLNCYRSAISSTHLPIEGFPIWKHPLVTRLLKGAFNERPPLQKNASTWEVSTVLTYLSQLGQNKNLTLSVLTKKLTMLLALVLAHRSSDLKRLTSKAENTHENGVYLMPIGLGKQCWPGSQQGYSPYLLQHMQRIHPCAPSYACSNMRRQPKS